MSGIFFRSTRSAQHSTPFCSCRMKYRVARGKLVSCRCASSILTHQSPGGLPRLLSYAEFHNRRTKSSNRALMKSLSTLSIPTRRVPAAPRQRSVIHLHKKNNSNK